MSVSTQDAQAASVLAGAGVRATRQRVTVLGELMRERDDATAQQLYERLRGRGERLGLATVYRTLGLLAQEGLVDALSHHPGELCYRWCGEGHHHHLVCTSCHRVVEIEECELDPWLDRLAVRHDFASVAHRLEVSGLCSACR